MKTIPGMDIKLPRAIEAMMRGGDQKGAVRALMAGCDMARPLAQNVLRLWCLRQAQLEAAAVARRLEADHPCADERQIPLFTDLDRPVRGCA